MRFGDEIGQLGAAFNTMVESLDRSRTENARLLEELKAKEQMRLQLLEEIISAVGAVFLLLASGHGGEGGRIAGKVKGKWVEKHQVVVFVQDPLGRKAGRPAERPVMDQKDRTFVPHILPVVVGTTVEFTNSDPFKHNIFSPDGEGNFEIAGVPSGKYVLMVWGRS